MAAVYSIPTCFGNTSISPYINTIENLSSYVDAKVRQHSISNKDLRRVLLKESEKIEPSYYENLVKYILNRLEQAKVNAYQVLITI